MTKDTISEKLPNQQNSDKMIPVSRTFTTDIKNKLQECRKTKNQCCGASSAAIATEVSSGKE